MDVRLTFEKEAQARPDHIVVFNKENANAANRYAILNYLRHIVGVTALPNACFECP